MNEFSLQDLEDQKPLQSVRVFGVDLKAGDKVRLWPKRGGDVMDVTMQNKVATIEAIEQDFEGKVYLAVVLDDDPGRDLGLMRQPGHRFFFSVDEVEPMVLTDNRRGEA
jgi:hypothetical protein